MTKNYKLINVNFFAKDTNASHGLLALILITLPLKNIYTSIATILFVATAFLLSKKNSHFQKANYWPIAFFLLMSVSVFWSQDFNSSVLGIQKQLSMLFIPVAFFFIPKTSKETISNIIRIYSFGMVLFGLYYLISAGFKYTQTHNVNLLFHDELVPYDPGAIYMSVFASFAFFHFLQLKSKTNLDHACILILALLIFLLSSKSVITIDFIIIICYYSFFAPIPSGTKTLTIISVSLFLFLSLFYVKEVRERFLIEYETAFIDNTLNDQLTGEKQIYNVSINEAWNKKDFHQNSFFPGTAMRIYQIRIFTEMVIQNPKILFSGFGLEASQQYIGKKAKEHNLNPTYAEFNFHNQYVQTIAEIGVFGFLILMGMLYVNLKNAFRSKDFLHITFSITMLMLFLSESFFCRQRGIVFFIVLYCLFNSDEVQKQQ